jgi:hypothetical protein
MQSPRLPGSLSPSLLGSPVPVFHLESPAVYCHDVAGLQFLAATGFHLSVDLHLSVLNQQLGLTTAAGDALYFQKLIESNRFHIGIVLQGRLNSDFYRQIDALCRFESAVPVLL